MINNFVIIIDKFIIRQTMNKFAKTCYPRQINHNNFMKAANQKRED